MLKNALTRTNMKCQELKILYKFNYKHSKYSDFKIKPKNLLIFLKISHIFACFIQKHYRLVECGIVHCVCASRICLKKKTM